MNKLNRKSATLASRGNGVSSPADADGAMQYIVIELAELASRLREAIDGTPGSVNVNACRAVAAKLTSLAAHNGADHPDEDMTPPTPKAVQHTLGLRTSRAAQLLLLLIETPGLVHSLDDITGHLESPQEVVRVYIFELRTRLEALGVHINIRNMRSQGYYADGADVAAIMALLADLRKATRTEALHARLS